MPLEDLKKIYKYVYNVFIYFQLLIVFIVCNIYKCLYENYFLFL